VALVAALMALLLVAPAIAETDFGEQVAGQRVYDHTGALTAEQVASIEQQAAAVADAGSPTIVYLQSRDTSYDNTVDDARALMDQWDIQSQPDAHDGVVIFFNLKPDDVAHGNYTVVAGKALLDGNVPQRELNRTANLMRPYLEDGDIAAAIGVGLSTIEQDLREGPPPPPPPSTIERLADDVAGGAISVLNVLSLLVAAAAGWVITRAFPKRRTSNLPVVPAAYPPDALSPAIAGALVNGSVTDANIAATILDLAARGALAIEPEPGAKKKVQIRLIDESLVHPGFEQLVWQGMTKQADTSGIIVGKRLSKIRSDWGDIRKALTADLIERGWLDARAGDKRKPFYIGAAVLFVVAFVAAIIAAIASSPWPFIAILLIGTAACVAVVVGSMIPSTTEAGDEIAAPWRGYRRYLKSAGRNPQADLDLDTAIPIAVSLGVGNALDKRLKAASASGYLPVWLGGSQSEGGWAGAGFYPYWIAFNSTVAPTASSSTSTGASAGSGAAGGSF
jgi:uncharacterized protein (TIGR04222 family)